MIDQPMSWRMFLSLGTLFSGVLMAVVLQLEYGWVVACSLVGLLYIHEAGHVVVASLRRVPVLAPPTFIMGLGAQSRWGCGRGQRPLRMPVRSRWWSICST